MRWDRLFDDIEALAAEVELDERDALAQDLRDGDWAETSWRDLLGGEVVLDVRGVGRLAGVVELVNARIIRLGTKRLDHVVDVAAVLQVLESERRADSVSAVGSALGWPHVLRGLRDAGEEIRLRLQDGQVREGTVDVVGRDFVRIRNDGRQRSVVSLAAIAVLSGRT